MCSVVGRVASAQPVEQILRAVICGDCDHKVYRCRTDEQLKYAMKKNRCVALRFKSLEEVEPVEELLGLPMDPDGGPRTY